jgi:predicted ATPase/transcriptional regulator with XRE-family HTH domain
MGAEAYTQFGLLLRRHRLAAGFTQAMLAARAGISERAINDLERDPRRSPRLETVTLLAKALGLGSDERAQLLASARPGTYPQTRHDSKGDRSSPSHASAARIASAPDVVLPAPRAPLRPPDLGSYLIATSPFVGRSHEMAAISARLREPSVRLLTLTGPGGIGKTRLAFRAATLLRDQYADGSYFVALESLTDPALVLPTIAAAIGAPESAHLSAVHRLADALHGREVLLVLDNFEHVSPAAGELAQVLATCGGLSLLVTSRTSLHLAAEHEYPVPPLATPHSPHWRSILDLQAFDAIALFLQRARASLPGFDLSVDNAHTIEAICARLDGIPLAIELAAARVKVLPPASLLARLDRQLTILTGGPPDMPVRQRTVRATLDWSHGLLTEDTRALLRRVAVFSGGWTLDAAECICADSTVAREDTLDLLTRLVDHSLVVVSERDSDTRYRLLEPIRQYAEEKLRDAGEEETLRERHLAWYLDLAERIESQGWILPRPTSQTVLRPELDNLRAALAWSRRDASGQTELRLAGTLTALWALAGVVSEGRAVLRNALDRADPAARTSARARALMAGANLAGVQTDAARAGLYSREALAILREVGANRYVAQALLHDARARYWLGGETELVAARDESLGLCRTFGDHRAYAETLWLWADLALDRGDYAAARRQLEECVAVCREIDDPFMLAYPLISLARTACAEDDVERARGLAEEGVTLRRMGAPAWLLAIALTALAEVERCADNDVRASALLEEALELFLEGDARAGIAWSMHNLGHVALRAGDLERAEHLFKQALAVRHRDEYFCGIATELAAIAGACCSTGEYERAARLFGAAEALLENSRSVLAPADLKAFARDVAILQLNVQEPETATVWASGREAPIDQIVFETLATAH